MRPLLLVLVLLFATAVPPASGESVGDQTIEDRTVHLTYQLRVEPGTTLTLRNATIQFDGGSILVEPAARLVVERSTLVEVSGSRAGRVIVDGEMSMTESLVDGIVGIESQAGTLVVSDSEFRGNGVAILAYRTALLQVNGSRFIDNANGGAQVRDARLEVSDSFFSGNGGEYGAAGILSTVAGSALFGKGNGFVRGSTFVDNGKSVHVQGGDPVEVTSNCFRGNFAGVTAQQAAAPLVRQNAFEENTYAYYNHGDGGMPFTADVRENWWGTADGPSSSGPNAVVGADGVTLLTSPWLTVTPLPAC